jgi:protein ImuB
MPFACIFVPDFPVQAVLRAEPGLRSQPVAVLEGKAPLQKVFAVNEKARRMGVEPGMSRLQLEECGDLALRPQSSFAETDAHDALLECAQSFSPRVEDAACDTLLLDLAGLEALFGPPPKIADDLARHASEFGLEANIAVAANVDTALLAARGFLGVTVISEGQEAERLGSLPVAVLLMGGQDTARFLEILNRWGIHDLRSLAALPEAALSERLGQGGIFLQQLARGITFRDLVPVEEPPVFEKAVELEHPLVLLEPLAFLLHQLLEEICAHLAAYALATQELTLQMVLSNCHFNDAETDRVGPDETRQPFTRILRLPVPLLDPKIFLKLLQLDLNANPPGAPIRKIHLSAKPARPRAAQGGLFLPPSPEPEKLELTLARIASIVGNSQVGSLELLDTYRPDGFRMQRFAPQESQQRKGASATVCGTTEVVPSQKPQPGCAHNLVTALRIFRPPVRALVVIRDGKPAHITCPKREMTQGEILWTAGPWRSSGDWWEHEGWARDEWDIAVQEKSGIVLYRLVRDLLNGQWLVEGSYD